MKCIECGSAMKAAKVPHKIVVAMKTYSGQVAAMVCSKGHELIDGKDLGRFEVSVAAAVANSGQVNGETFRFMRKAIGLSAVELAPLLDTTPETISRWENGKMTVDRPSWVTLGGLAVERDEERDELFDRLTRLAAGKVSPAKTVKIAS